MTLPSMSRRETIAGILWFIIYCFFMNVLVELVLTLLGVSYSLAALNAVYFLANFLITALIFHRFLTSSLSLAARTLPRVCKGIVLGLCAYLLLTILPQALFSLLPGEITIPNDDTIAAIAEENYRVMWAGAVLLAPLTEETLIRGLIFGTLQKKNRPAAYAVTAVLFAALHMVAYIGTMEPLTVLYQLLTYGMPSVALCLCYEYAGTIWAPILLHMAINAMGMAGL